jgi:hypothetical protein
MASMTKRLLANEKSLPVVEMMPLLATSAVLIASVYA